MPPLCLSGEHFNPRPREEGDIEGFDSVTYTADFNPRPREEGDVINDKQGNYESISIHALVKRATRNNRNLVY